MSHRFLHLLQQLLKALLELFTVARLLVIRTRLLFNLLDLSEKTRHLFYVDRKQRKSKES